jgi:hypothetical protein
MHNSANFNQHVVMEPHYDQVMDNSISHQNFLLPKSPVPGNYSPFYVSLVLPLPECLMKPLETLFSVLHHLNSSRWGSCISNVFLLFNFNF